MSVCDKSCFTFFIAVFFIPNRGGGKKQGGGAYYQKYGISYHDFVYLHRHMGRLYGTEKTD